MKDFYAIINVAYTIYSGIATERISLMHGDGGSVMCGETVEDVIECHPHLIEQEDPDICCFDIGLLCISDEDYMLWKLTGQKPKEFDEVFFPVGLE